MKRIFLHIHNTRDENRVEIVFSKTKKFFGDFVRKMLENPAYEGIPPKNQKTEVIKPRVLRFGSGGRI